MNKTICTELIINFATKMEEYLAGCLSKEKAIVETKSLLSANLIDSFFDDLDEVKAKLAKDLDFYMQSDPAADSEEEVVFAYPGYKAIVYYRLANVLVKYDQRFIARVISEHAHYLTGIDIHPAASIGCPFFIDHGTGIVIGETAIVGDYVKMYQGVTLGAISLSKGASLKGVKRHPTIKNHVTIYSNASILGGDVVIGNNVVIGSNVFLSKSVPDNHKVIMSPQELVMEEK